MLLSKKELHYKELVPFWCNDPIHSDHVSSKVKIVVYNTEKHL